MAFVSPEEVLANFDRQPAMALLGATLTVVSPGVVEIAFPFKRELTQQDGFIHAGIITTAADSACGYAALSSMPAGSDVLSVEFKVNLLSPGRGDLFRADARVVRPGRTLTVCQAEVTAVTGSEDVVVALMQATMIRRPVHG